MENAVNTLVASHPFNHYHLTIDGQPTITTLSVLSLSGREDLNQPWRYEINFTYTDKQIAVDAIFRRSDNLIFQTPHIAQQLTKISAKDNIELYVPSEITYGAQSFPFTDPIQMQLTLYSFKFSENFNYWSWGNDSYRETNCHTLLFIILVSCSLADRECIGESLDKHFLRYKKSLDKNINRGRERKQKKINTESSNFIQKSKTKLLLII
ncbi:hypothetical protein [Gilliamella apis]|uniref:hypothetical protein n=1 Tax=Gilliamella apis TaxID=1970738 RepID=UPI000A350AD5|nr:hypothetical protein [Gilliamella apis]OTQ81063.1 hypothetical protein B6D14_02685 [Gilliamella apis]